MQGAGFAMKSFQSAYTELLQLNSFHISSREALREFIEINRAPDRCYDVGIDEIYENPRFNDPIQPVEDAVEVLQELHVDHQLALVTKGREKIQREKMRRAGISTEFFTRLYFCDGGNKKKAYQKAVEETGISPLNALVCADRIALDLAPAKALGYNTVQIKWGRGLGNTGLKKDVDYTILHLKELHGLLGDLFEKIK